MSTSRRTLGVRFVACATYFLERVQIGVLANVPVLVETVLGYRAALQVDAQRQVQTHDALVRLAPLSVFLASDHVVEHFKGGLALADFDEL